MKIKGLSRSDFNRLMAIPEAREIYEARIAELKLMFKKQLALEESALEMTSNLVRLPIRRGPKPGKTKTPATTGSRIIDASRFKRENEEEQVKIFLDYFERHPAVRQSVLDNFFLKILPYTAVDVTPEAKSG